MDLPKRVFRPLFIAMPLVMAMLVAVVTVSLALAVGIPEARAACWAARWSP